MGLRLDNPLVASASPMTATFDGVQRLADAGVGAVVLNSLFEEQLRERQARIAELVDGPADSFAEALDYMPAVTKVLVEWLREYGFRTLEAHIHEENISSQKQISKVGFVRGERKQGNERARAHFTWRLSLAK
jgi:hypothetical protein